MRDMKLIGRKNVVSGIHESLCVFSSISLHLQFHILSSVYDLTRFEGGKMMTKARYHVVSSLSSS